MAIKSISYTEIRKKFKPVLDKVCEDHQPVYVTRRNGGNVVILSESDFESIQETAYLLKSPANAKRLLE